MLEHGVVDEPVLPDGSITVDLVSATIEALTCDDRSRRNDHDDDARRWADCELAGQLCNLYQVMRCYTVNCDIWLLLPADCSSIGTVAAQVDMRSILHKLAVLYVASCDDLRAARDTGKVAQRLIAQHANRSDGNHLPGWGLRGTLGKRQTMAATSSSWLYHYFANTIMQIQKRAGGAAHKPLPPWLRSALQRKPSQSCTDADIDSAQLPRGCVQHRTLDKRQT